MVSWKIMALAASKAHLMRFLTILEANLGLT